MTAGSIPLQVRCNGVVRDLYVRSDRLLGDVLREDLQLTGCKIGCGTGDCGACTLLLNDEPVNGCLVYAVECAGADVQTIEHVADEAVGAAIVDALVAEGAIQCGICTPGIVVAAAAFLSARTSPPSSNEIVDALAGNLCRCTGYYPIVKAIERAATTVLTPQRGRR